MSHRMPGLINTICKVSVVLSAFLAGKIASISLLAIPTAIDCSTNDAQLLRMWRFTESRSRKRGPPFVLLICVLYTVTAWTNYRYAQPCWTLVIAGVLVSSIITFEWALMGSTKRKLYASNGGVKQQQGDDLTYDTVAMVRRWGALNMLRALLPLIGAAFGCLAL